MFKFISNLINLNVALTAKARSLIAYDEAMVLYREKKFAEALPLMTESAELGDAMSMSIVGKMYLMGEGVKVDGLKAVHWLQRSVDSGYEEAISLLGMLYATGATGVKADIPKAREILTACAAKGDKQAIQMLALIESRTGIFSYLKKQKR